MELNKSYIYVNNEQEFKCVIKKIEKRLGSSVLNDKIQTMDLVYTEYYYIELEDHRCLWVSKHFLKDLNN